MTQTIDTTIGDLISVLYTEYLDLYGDEELASVATAASINDMLTDAAASASHAAEPAAAARVRPFTFTGASLSP